MPRRVGEAEGGDAVDDAEIDRLRLAAQVAPSSRSSGTPNIAEAVAAWMSMPLREGLLQLRDVGDMREQPQLDLAVIGRDDLVARPARRRPCGSCGPPPCGSGCSAGSDRTRRGAPSSSPRARTRYAPAWSPDACAAAGCRYRSISASRAGAIRGSLRAVRGRPAASSSSSVAGVAHWPDGVFFAPGRPILPNRMSPICFGEPSANFSPAISWISSSSRARRLREIAREAATGSAGRR